MQENRDPFLHNKVLYDALTNTTPLVLRDFAIMRRKIAFLVENLERSVAEASNLTDVIVSNEHGDECDACIILRNMKLRYSHDINLYRAYLGSTESLWKGITRTDEVNDASADKFLSLALTTRAVLDNIFRSCTLFIEVDVRTYNKYLADSLLSFSKLEWSTLPQSVNHGVTDALEKYASLSHKERNNSALYSDPAPNFKLKLDYLRRNCKEESFVPFFTECEKLYNALSDMVHGGIAALTASDPKGGQIIMGTPDLRYVASAHQLAELIGVTLVMGHKLLIDLYLPVLAYTFSRIEDSAKLEKQFSKLRSTLAKRIKGFDF